MPAFLAVLRSAALTTWTAAQLLSLSASTFGALALLVKGREAIAAARRATREVRLNLSLYFIDAVLVGPVLAVLIVLVRSTLARHSLALFDPRLWLSLGRPVTFVAVVVAGDFVGYWRHRLEHTPVLWPAHAVHHSDTQMTWLTLARFHPINRLTTQVIDVGCLVMLGFPDWGLVAYVMVRHYYGELIHADLPWMFGPMKWVLVSPVMHQWHHARDVEGSGSNFATVFSVFDWAFGTYYMPGLCTVPLGVTDDMGVSTLRQLCYPFVSWAQWAGSARH